MNGRVTRSSDSTRTDWQRPLSKPHPVAYPKSNSLPVMLFNPPLGGFFYACGCRLHRQRAVETPPRLRALCVAFHALHDSKQIGAIHWQHWPHGDRLIRFAILQNPANHCGFFCSGYNCTSTYACNIHLY